MIASRSHFPTTNPTAPSSACARSEMAPPIRRNEAGKPHNAERWFSSAAEISQSLRSQDEQGLLGGTVRTEYSDPRMPYLPWTVSALTSLRNQLTVKYSESALPPDDGRIRLAREWMERSPGANELFDLWATTNQVRSIGPLSCGQTQLILFLFLASDGALCRSYIPDLLSP